MSKNILIIEDTPAVSQAIETGLELSTQFSFVSKIATGYTDYASQGLFKQSFDLGIIDLRFETPGVDESWGIEIGNATIFGLAKNHPNTPLVVYSGHPEIPNVVRAMQVGASDFVPKSHIPPHELVTIVEQKLFQYELNRQREQNSKAILEHRSEEWIQKYGKGSIVALHEGNVVAVGEEWVEVSAKYCNLRLQKHPAWPVEPEWHQI